jgi:chromosome partitioning protein
VEDAFDDTPVWKVRERAAVQRALTNGSSLFIEAPECDQIEVFEEIANDLDKQFHKREITHD